MIEDGCHALGGHRDGTMVGGPGAADMTTFSFHPVKAMTTGEGGLVTTEDDALARRLRAFRTHGIVREGLEPGDTDGGWVYDMQALGFNYRITDFQCALGLSQLERLDGWVERRNAIAERYRELLAGDDRIELPPEAGAGSLHAYHLFVIRLRDGAAVRRRVFEHLRDAGIWVQVHYIPVYRLTYYRRTLGYPQDECPAAEALLCRRDLASDVPGDGRRRRRSRGVGAAGGSRLSRFGRPFLIGERRVGPGEPCYVIAEAGANHNRDLGIATELIDAAAEAGADAVKFQTYTGGLYSTRPRTSTTSTTRARRRAPRRHRPAARLAGDLADHARTRDPLLLLPFDHEAVDGLRELGVPAMKIASFEIVDLPLIRHAAAAGVPVIVSTGMATYGEIEDALGAVADGGNRKVALLRCASVYPSPPEIMNLRAIRRCAARSASRPACPITRPASWWRRRRSRWERSSREALHARPLDGGPRPSLRARARRAEGDGRGVREVEAALGDGICEGRPRPRRGRCTRSRAAAHRGGRHPGRHRDHARDAHREAPRLGIAPKHLELLIGRRARVDIEYDDPVTWEMV